MLPTNPQSLTATDRTVLENLRQQGDQIDRQTKVLETLIDRVTRQMRSGEKLEKNSKKDEVGKDTRVKDIPGILFDKFSDGLNDYIANEFKSIKDMFKENKTTPIDKSKEPSLKNTVKEPKNEKDVLKNILNNMVTTSKYQEQMLEHTRAIQSIADKTLVSIDSLKNVVQPEDNPNIENPQNTEMDNPKQKEDDVQNVVQPKDNTKIENLQNTEMDNPKQKEDDTKKIKSNTTKQVPALFLSKEKLENDNNKTTLNSNDTKLPNSIGVAVGKSLKPHFDVLGKIFKDSLKEGFDQLDESISNLNGIGLPSLIPTPGGSGSKPGGKLDKATKVAAGTTAAATAASSGLKGNAGKILQGAGKVSLPLLFLSEVLGTSDEDLAKARSADEKKKGTQAQVRAVDNKIESAESERNAADKKTGGRYTEGRLERRADKIKPEYLKFAQQFYNDPNLQDPDYLSLPENKGILELLEERQKENLLPKIEKVTPKKKESASLMKEVTDENRELTSKGSTQGAPVIVNNTTNNMSEQGSSMNFASATSTNPNDSVRDYKRNNARLFDSA
jgi:hypothetical protein